MKCLILGATGRLGQMLQWAWPANSPLVPIWQTRQIPCGPRAHAPHWVVADPLAAQGGLDRILAGVDVVINLLGVVPSPGADLNLNAPLALAPWTHGFAGPVMVASSAAVYGAGHGGLLHEDQTPAPLHDYGRAKVDMERAVQAQDPRALILRIGNVAGADQLLGGLRDGQTPVLHQFDDGTTPVRSYIGPQGLADVICAVAQTPRAWPGVMNVAAPTPVAMGDMLDAAGRAWTPAPAPVTLPPRVVFDTARLAAFLDVQGLSQTAPALVAEWQAWQKGPQ